MNTRGVILIALIVIGVAVTCVVMGWYAGRSGAQQMSGLSSAALTGTPVSLQSGRRIRLYLGRDVGGEPAYTFVAGRVYHGSQLGQPILTLENDRVYAGSGPAGPLLYEFTDDRIVEGQASRRTAFVQRDNAIHFGPDPNAPALFTFEGTRIYWGSPGDSRILATSNTVINDPDLMKLVSIVLYMEILE